MVAAAYGSRAAGGATGATVATAMSVGAALAASAGAATAGELAARSVPLGDVASSHAANTRSEGTTSRRNTRLIDTLHKSVRRQEKQSPQQMKGSHWSICLEASGGLPMPQVDGAQLVPGCALMHVGRTVGAGFTAKSREGAVRP